MLDKCSETCGWIAGIIAAFSFGTFGVPIKDVKSKMKVDPLVMQSYKSLLCFLTCWLVIPLGEPFKFTPWGIVSGMFWVPGATAGIYGIQNAGLAVSVGIWSSIIVISSFFWGILVFGEGVKSKLHAFEASVILILGLVGMSTYSAPVQKKGKREVKPLPDISDDDTSTENIALLQNIDDRNNSISLSQDGMSESATDEENGSIELTYISSNNSQNVDLTTLQRTNSNLSIDDDEEEEKHIISASTTEFAGGKIVKRRKNANDTNGTQTRSPIKPKKIELHSDTPTEKTNLEVKDDELVHFFGRFSLTRRQLGLIGATINGVWGSNNMVPMHYARAKGFYGAGYLISYSVGSMIVTVLLWLIRYCFNVYYYGNFQKAYHALPPFHVRTLCGPGSMAGFLYSLGNFCCIITVSALGQGVGYSFVQISMLISGLWGIFYFHEVTGSERIFKWIMSSCVTVIGILALSYEHQGSSAH